MLDRFTQTVVAVAAGGVFVVVLTGLTITGWVLNKREQRR